MTTEANDKKQYETTRFNSVKHGLRSSVSVLPHESKEAFNDLRDKFMVEYLPQGPTEEMLVEELISIVWRKRRVLSAEAASLNKGLERSISFPLNLINTSRPFHLHVENSPSLSKYFLIANQEGTEKINGHPISARKEKSNPRENPFQGDYG